MAYQKHNWLDRDTEFPDRRRLYPTDGGAERSYRVQRDEGTVYEEGDPFSAEQMNGMEGRIAAADAEQRAALEAHGSDTGNPHEVTKDQVGLGNADNTPDSEKSVRHASWSARLGNEASNPDYVAVRPAAGTPQGYMFLQNQDNEYILTGINGLGGRPVRNSQQLNGQPASYYATAEAAKAAADAAAAARTVANAAMPKGGGAFTGYIQVPNLQMKSTTGESQLFMGSDGSAWLDWRTSGNGLLIRSANGSSFRAVFASNTEHASSRRYKENIVPLEAAQTTELLDLPVYQYQYRKDSPFADGGLPHQGFVAEEVAERLGEGFIFRDDEGRVEGVKHHAMVAPLLRLVQDLQGRVCQLEKQLSTQCDSKGVRAGGIPEESLA